MVNGIQFIQHSPFNIEHSTFRFLHPSSLRPHPFCDKTTPVKKDVPIAIASIVIIVGLCFGLAAMRPEFPAIQSTPFSTSPAAKTSTNAAIKNDKVVMRVNGEPVTEREFAAFRQQAPEQMQAFYASAEGRRTLADQLVKLKSLEQEGRKLGVENDPDAAGRIEMARANIIAAFTLQKMVSLPDDRRLRAEFEKQKKNFETVQLSHILIAYAGGPVPPRSGAPLSEADAMRKAQAIVAMVRSGADFAQLARTQSDDVNSAAEGGRLGDVSPGSLPAELQEAVSNLKAQQLGQPVRSSYGIHIFKSGNRKSRGYDELKPMLASKMQRDEAEATLSRLQKTAKVELDPKFFPQQPNAATVPRGRS
jgi:peptidyl-prolyl cis-trans isomerase C